ncbi:MAG: SEL1-like repeat protein [Gammaproteobacteria bacterium]|nr:SEL1-like repeat protein [Gammaproteobacteria bacterium]MDH3411890.1 SEL1-like repeat protein [Gammaproteobacteria bacterium]
METMSRKRITLAGPVLGLALVISGCSSMQPKFDSAVDGIKSFFKGDGASQQPAKPSSKAEIAYDQAHQMRAAGKNDEYTRRLEDAANLGHPGAAYELGIAYTQGRVVPKDLNTGARWINRSADLGDQRAQYLIGANFMTGDGADKNPERGVAFLARAGEQGHVQAQYLLGVAYADGNGVSKNPAWAARWYGRAARGGNVDAQYAYGVMYGSGMGIPENDRKAYYWLTLAASGGHAKAGEVAMQIAKRLSNEEISQVEADAKRFVPRSYASLTDPATVMFVQYALRNIGYDAGPVDGMPGKQTKAGIRAYEEARNLPVNGKISVSVLDGLIQSTSR